MRRKILSMLLAVAMVVAAAGCGQGGGKTENNAASTDQKTEGHVGKDALKIGLTVQTLGNQPAISPTEGLDAMETILQANPDIKVVCCIGGGGAAGANEAYKGHYGSEVPDNVGIFSTDLTDETVASMENGEFNRMCVAITGNPYVCGETIYGLTIRVAGGEKMEQNVYRDLIQVTIENLKEMVTE